MTGSIISFPWHILCAVGLQGSAEPWLIFSLFPSKIPIVSACPEAGGAGAQWKYSGLCWVTFGTATARWGVRCWSLTCAGDKHLAQTWHSWASPAKLQNGQNVAILSLNHLYLSNFWTKFIEQESCKMMWQWNWAQMCSIYTTGGTTLWD